MLRFCLYSYSTVHSFSSFYKHFTLTSSYSIGYLPHCFSVNPSSLRHADLCQIYQYSIRTWNITVEVAPKLCVTTLL